MNNSITLKILSLFSILSFSLHSLATEQIPDNLKFQDKTLAVHYFPLEKLFDSSQGLKERLTTAKGDQILSTANHRGYIASFEILNNRLVVSDIELEQQFKTGKLLEPVSIINKVFPNKKDRNMSWFTGIIRGGFDDTGGVVYLPNVHQSLYKDYLVFKVIKGQIVEIVEMNQEQFRDYDKRLLAHYMKTSEYKELHNDQVRANNKNSRYRLNAEIFRTGNYTQQTEVPFILLPPSTATEQNKAQHN